MGQAGCLGAEPRVAVDYMAVIAVRTGFIGLSTSFAVEMDCAVAYIPTLGRVGTGSGRNLSAAAIPSTMNSARVTSWVAANGGSVCVGASACSAGTLRNT
jgi:hypothetical protein